MNIKSIKETIAESIQYVQENLEKKPCGHYHYKNDVSPFDNYIDSIKAEGRELTDKEKLNIDVFEEMECLKITLYENNSEND